MLALVVTACLNSNPTACGDQVIAWMPYETEARCLIGSRQRMSAWAQAHPEVTLVGASCMSGRHGVAPRSEYVVMASHKLTD